MTWLQDGWIVLDVRPPTEIAKVQHWALLSPKSNSTLIMTLLESLTICAQMLWVIQLAFLYLHWNHVSMSWDRQRSFWCYSPHFNAVIQSPTPCRLAYTSRQLLSSTLLLLCLLYSMSLSLSSEANHLPAEPFLATRHKQLSEVSTGWWGIIVGKVLCIVVTEVLCMDRNLNLLYVLYVIVISGAIRPSSSHKSSACCLLHLRNVYCTSYHF